MHKVDDLDQISPRDTIQVGTIHGTGFGNAYGSIGEMCFSPQGDKLLAVGVSGFVDLFDFDRCTGLLSNWKPLGTEAPSFPGFNTYYGCSFSPDGTKIYASEWVTFNNFGERLYQWDLNAPDIAASKTLIHTWAYSTGIQTGQHQLGPDGRVYLAQMIWPADSLNLNDRYLSVINYPDSAGLACGFVENGLYLEGRRSTLHLPNLPNYNLGPLLAQTAEAGPPEIVLCPTDSAVLGYPDTTGGRVKYLWDGPGVSGDTTAQVTVSPAAPGAMYRLQAFDPFYPDCGLTKDSVWVRPARPDEIPVAYAGNDTTVCAGDTVALGGGAGGAFDFAWTGPGWIAEADSAATVSVGAGMYVLEVRNPTRQGWCYVDRDTVDVMWIAAPTAPQAGFAGADVLLCAGDTVVLGTGVPSGWVAVWDPQDELDDPGAAATLAWPSGDGMYVLQLIDSASGGVCFSLLDTVQVLVEQPFTHAAPPALVRLCPGGCAVVGVAPVVGMTYAWSPAAGLDDATASMTVARPSATTTYVLTVTDTALSSAGCRELRFEVVAEVEVCARQTMLQAGVGVLDLGPYAGVTELTVWDLQGRLVWFDADYPSDPSTGSGTSGFTAAGFARGVYVYRVRRQSEWESESVCGDDWVSKLVVW